MILNENWIYFSDRITWKSDLQYTIRSKAIDKTNNTENPNSGIVFMYDNKPPENLSIIINNNDVKTDSNRINLKLNSEDTGSGNYQMSFSYDKITWTELEDFQFTKDLIIPKNKGTIEIYFKVRDYAGNEAEPVGVSIIIDENSNKDKINWVLIGIITVVIMIVAIILFFLFIKPRMGGRNESEDKKKEEPQKPVEPDQKQYDSQQNQYQSLYNQSPSQQRQQKFPPYQ